LQSVDWQTIGLLMLAGFILVGAIISAPLMWRLYRVKTDPSAAAFKRFTAKLNRAGLKHEAWEGPQDLLARVNDPRYALSTASQTAARAVIEHYISLRYGMESTQTGAQKRATVAQLRRMISGFRPRSK
jgi:Domain of unknown function (DUF4129)